MYFRILLLPSYVVRFTAAEADATPRVLIWVCCSMWDRSKSSAKSKSSGCILRVHCIPIILLRRGDHYNAFNDRERKGENRWPCLKTVLISNASVSCHPCTTLQFSSSLEFRMVVFLRTPVLKIVQVLPVHRVEPFFMI